MLPMIVNACLASGAISMSKKRTIVKKLDSIINFGSMDVLCTDKTGTLTQNKVVLVKHVDLNGNTCTFPLEMSFLNSNFQTGLRNLIDEAILEYYEKISSRDRELQTSSSDYTKIDEIPFDFVRRRMSVILSGRQGEFIVVSKGALEEMLQICTHYKDKEQGVIPLTNELKEKSTRLADQLNEDGLRVVAVGYKNLPTLPKAFSVADENSMILAGLVAFLDPPKESTTPAIRELIARGVEIKVLTGDTPVVCRKGKCNVACSGSLISHMILHE